MYYTLTVINSHNTDFEEPDLDGRRAPENRWQLTKKNNNIAPYLVKNLLDPPTEVKDHHRETLSLGVCSAFIQLFYNDDDLSAITGIPVIAFLMIYLAFCLRSSLYFRAV